MGCEGAVGSCRQGGQGRREGGRVTGRVWRSVAVQRQCQMGKVKVEDDQLGSQKGRWCMEGGGQMRWGCAAGQGEEEVV